jgi:hypothetical protein
MSQLELLIVDRQFSKRNELFVASFRAEGSALDTERRESGNGEMLDLRADELRDSSSPESPPHSAPSHFPSAIRSRSGTRRRRWVRAMTADVQLRGSQIFTADA